MAGAGRVGRSPGLPAFAVAALLLLGAGTPLLWATGPSNPDGQPRLPPSESPFPSFLAASHVRVVSVPPTANASTRLTLASLQGLANRERAEVFLDVRGDAASPDSLFAFLVRRYGLTVEVVDVASAYARYLPGLSGLVVYDPARPESVNVATVYASVYRAAIAGPDTAPWLSRAHGLPILLDYGASDWARLDAIGAYERALRELYPLCTDRLISILPPEDPGTRDYVIAARAFVFYHEQGPLASPAELASTTRILRATPRGIPVLGWFRSPTMMEENAFVQLASREGKVLVGAEDVPNLSLLSAFGRDEVAPQAPAAVGSISLEDTVYAVVAVPDGDNVGFASGTMWDLWHSPVRGTMPIAWSLGPLLADLAPPLLEYYGSTATAGDRIVAAPSGAGYLYPDNTGPGDLAPYLASSKRYLDATGMDVVWLLNTFPASETPYRSETLSAYVDALRPRALVLDYDDQPKTRDSWMQSGDAASAPVIRSTHLWTTRENFLAKVDAARGAWDRGPQFLWITVYPYTFDLEAARSVLDELAARLDRRLEVVTPERFFALLEWDFVARARDRLRAVQADPFASVVLSPLVAAAERRGDAAQAALAAGDSRDAATEAFAASELLRQVAAWEAILAVLLLVAIPALLAFGVPRRTRIRAALRRADGPVALAATTALFFLALRAALDANFWTYASVPVAMAVAGLAVPVRRFLDARFPAGPPIPHALLALVLVALATLTSAMFPAAMVGSILVADAILVRSPVPPEGVVAGVGLGVAAGLLLPPGLAPIGLLGLLLLGGAARLPTASVKTETGRVRGAWRSGALLALPLVAAAPAFSYSLGVRLDVDGPLLAYVSAGALACGVLLAAVVARWRRIRHRRLLAFVAAGGLALSLAAVGGTLLVSLVLAALAACLALAAIDTLRSASSEARARASVRAAFVLTPVLLLFLRMPPIAYSLVAVPLPEAVELALYAPQLWIAGVALACAAGCALGFWRRTRKGYPARADGGMGGET